jgi:predicted molibdopterin-dependent oxidoreductase YjgC
MKLVNGKYQKISWEQAINEVGDKLAAIRKESGPDAVFWVGSSKHSNEQSYLLRKFVSYSAATTATTRLASAIRPPLPASPTRGATAR